MITSIVQASQDRQSYVPAAQVRRQLRWAIAIAIQKGNAMTIRSGWIRAVGVGRAASAASVGNTFNDSMSEWLELTINDDDWLLD